MGCRTPPAGPEAGGYARAMEPARSATPQPQGPRRVTTVLALLTAGLLTAGTGLVVLASPPALIGALALLLSLTPLAVAAVILRPRAPGPVTTADHLTMLRLLGAGALAAVIVLALAGQLPSRGWVLAALIGALQGVSLLAATVPVIPTQLATGILAVALALLVLSFGRDVIAQERAEWRAQAGLREQA